MHDDCSCIIVDVDEVAAHRLICKARMRGSRRPYLAPPNRKREGRKKDHFVSLLAQDKNPRRGGSVLQLWDFHRKHHEHYFLLPHIDNCPPFLYRRGPEIHTDECLDGEEHEAIPPSSRFIRSWRFREKRKNVGDQLPSDYYLCLRKENATSGQSVDDFGSRRLFVLVNHPRLTRWFFGPPWQ